MIIYIADRKGKVKASCSTKLAEKSLILEDLVCDDVASGIKTIELTFKENDELKHAIKPGCFIMQGGKEYELYTVLDVERESEGRTIKVYGEDAGLDLINRIVGPWTATASMTLAGCVDQVLGSDHLGWNVRYESIDSGTSKGASYFDYTSDESATARLNSILGVFGAEMYFSYDIDGFNLVQRTINIVKKRGRKIANHNFYLGTQIKSITETGTIGSLATAFKVYGVDSSGNKKALSKLTGYSTYSGMTITPEDKSQFTGTRKYTYLVSGDEVRCTTQMNKWVSPLDKDGKILQVKETEYTSAKSAISYVITQLEKVADAGYSYQITFPGIQEGIGTGDYINIVDEKGKTYINARVLSWKKSEIANSFEVEIGSFAMLEGSKAASNAKLLVRNMSITSSNGIIGKDSLSTVLDVTVFQNGEKITDSEALSTGQKLFWFENGVLIPDDDERIGLEGFRLSVTDVRSACTYECRLMKDDEVLAGEQITLAAVKDGQSGADAITMAITSDNGTVFRNNLGSTTLTVHVYRAGVELSSAQISELGTIKWYRDGGVAAVGTGSTLTVTAASVSSKAVYACQLEG